METLEFNKKEAKAILEVFDSGIPYEQKKRDVLARIAYKLEKIVHPK